MRFKLLWQIHPLRAYLFAFSASLIGLTVLMLPDNLSRNTAPWLIPVAGILSFVFLARLPYGAWKHHLRYELLCFAGSSVLALCGWGLFIALNQSDEISRSDAELSFVVFMQVSAFAHVAVRLFARPFARWSRMRQAHLVWEITHAQLRLVALTMFILCVGLVLINLNTGFLSPVSPASITNFITMVIAQLGVFGVLTGILLFLVLIPASVISYLTARRITRRLDSFIAVTESIRCTDYSARVIVEGEDEISQLQTHFNQMMDELEKVREEVIVERDAVRGLLESRQRLFADVSHELRTPIATIRSYLEPLKKGQDISEAAEIIEREVLRLQRLIDDVFTLARADINQLHYDLQALEVGIVLERITQTFKGQAWQARRVEVVLDYQPQIPRVIADEERLEQVLYNLLRNAVRHTAPGGLIRIAASYSEDCVTIQIQDTGEGIAADDLPHVWDRFYRTAQSRAKDHSGAGLGLALVKEMVEAMGGQVSVTSEIGRGSCFGIQLHRVAEVATELRQSCD